MKKKYPIKDFMTKSLVTLSPEMNIFAAVNILLKHKISGAPVVDANSKLVGILSEKDCLELLTEDCEFDAFGETVADFYSQDVITVSPETGVFKVAEMFKENCFRRLPIISNGKLVGQVSRRDLLYAFDKIAKVAEKGTKTKIKKAVDNIQEAKKKLKTAINNLEKWPDNNRPPDSRGKPGGAVFFPDNDKREYIIVGDLHGNYHNLEAILECSGNLEKMKQDEAVLVLLGDLVHDDRPGHAIEMESSLQIFSNVVDLMISLPQNVIYLLGNHDTFSSKLSKRQVLQGKLFHESVLAAYDKEYADLMQKFFDSLPLVVLHPHFIAMHAGPIRGGCMKEELIDIRHYDDYLFQITWNRVNELNSTPSKKEYGPEDLDSFRRRLQYAENTPIIVGHNPFWKLGDNDSIWIDLLGCHDHIIIYSNMENICPFISIKGSAPYQVKYVKKEKQIDEHMAYFM